MAHRLGIGIRKRLIYRSTSRFKDFPSARAIRIMLSRTNSPKTSRVTGGPRLRSFRLPVSWPKARAIAILNSQNSLWCSLWFRMRGFQRRASSHSDNRRFSRAKGRHRVSFVRFSTAILVIFCRLGRFDIDAIDRVVVATSCVRFPAPKELMTVIGRLITPEYSNKAREVCS